MIWQMITLGKPRHLPHMSNPMFPWNWRDRASSEILVNISKQGSEKTLVIGMCRELGVAEVKVEFKQSEQEASFEKHPQSWPRSSLRARGVKKKNLSM